MHCERPRSLHPHAPPQAIALQRLQTRLDSFPRVKSRPGWRAMVENMRTAKHQRVEPEGAVDQAGGPPPDGPQGEGQPADERGGTGQGQAPTNEEHPSGQGGTAGEGGGRMGDSVPDVPAAGLGPSGQPAHDAMEHLLQAAGCLV